MNFEQREISLEDLGEKQQAAVQRAFRQLACAGSTAQNIKVIDVEGTIFTTFHIGDSVEQRWFEDTYQLMIGKLGKITMITGPEHMKEWNHKYWCGIKIKIR